MKKLLGAIFLPFLLVAEIQNVQITWTPTLCKGSCITGLEQRFLKINGVIDYAINEQAGMMNFKWKDNVRFTYMPINNAMAWIGLSINDMRVTVRGHIKQQGKNMQIVSDKDNTVFFLKSPVTPSNFAVTEFNPQSHVLTPQLEMTLQQGMKEGKIAIIEGQIFEPERSPPLLLIIDRISYEDPKKDKK